MHVRGHFGNLRAVLALLMILAMAVFSGGCGGSDGGGGTPPDSREKLYLLGEMHGDLADELAEKLAIYRFTGLEYDAPLLISYEDTFDIDDDMVGSMRALLQAGYAIGIEHATEAEINELLEALGFEGGFLMPTGHTYVEFYGIKLSEDGDVFTYVTLNDDEDPPVVLLSNSDSYMVSEGVFVSSDFELPIKLTSEDLVLLAEYGFTLSGDEIMSGDSVLTSADVISGDTMLTLDGEWVPFETEAPDEPDTTIEPDELEAIEDKLADSIVKWLYTTDDLQDARESKEELRRELSALGYDNLTQISSRYRKTYDASYQKLTFLIKVDVYALHTFDEADGTDCDWFIVKQSGELDPSAGYEKVGIVPIKNNTLPYVQGYSVNYAFENYLVDSSGNYVNTGIILDKSTPDTSAGSGRISAFLSCDFSGRVGYKVYVPWESSATSKGASYSVKESQTVPDCFVMNDSLAKEDGVIQNRAKWVYSFTRPQLDGRAVWNRYTFSDAPEASRALFQPVQQFMWKVPPEQRDNVKGMMFKFSWESGRSYGGSIYAGKLMIPPTHQLFQSDTTEFYVPFDMIYPPLIAANEINALKPGGSLKLTMVSYGDWTAESDQPWCRLSRTSGGKDDTEDVFVEIDENRYWFNRTAYITLKTTDGKDKVQVRVFQRS